MGKARIMVIEQTDNNEIIIRISASEDSIGVPRLIDYIRFMEIVSKSEATQEDIDELAEDINKSWWEKNKSRFIR